MWPVEGCMCVRWRVDMGDGLRCSVIVHVCVYQGRELYEVGRVACIVWGWAACWSERNVEMSTVCTRGAVSICEGVW